MAPLAKAKPLGKDIRSFFGNNQPRSSGNVPKADAIVISDDDQKPTQQEPPASLKSSKPVDTHKPRNDTREKQKKVSQPTPQAVKYVPVAEKPKSERVMEFSDDESAPRKPATSLKRKKPAVLMSSESEEDGKTPPVAKGAAVAISKPSPRKPPPVDATKRPKKARRVQAQESPSEDDDDDDLLPTKESIRRNERGKPPAKSGGTSITNNNPSMNAVDTPKIASSKAANWAAVKAARLAGPVAPGSKDIPEPASPDCLAGLAFVFTGELSSLSRNEAVDLAKKYGGRVVGQPSSVTSYVILGSDAGPAKLKAIEKHKLKTLNEDEFLDLIRTRKGPGANGAGLDAKARKKLEKEQESIRKAAKEMELMEKKAGKEKETIGGQKTVDVSSQLWTTRYAPQRIKDICGNKGQVEKLQQWLRDWPQSFKCGFKKPGKNGMNIFRAVMITGQPGIGKTTSAHLCAMLAGFTPIELNASDTRSKKLVERGMNIFNKSLDSWIGGSETQNAAGVPITDRACLIMDEVDGMSAGDRGGVGALNALIKKSKIPIICIANDRGAQKLKPLISSTFSLPFRKPEAAAIRSRIMSIIFKEKMKIPANVIDQLIDGAQSDIRQVLNMLSTWKLSSDSMNFDDGTVLAKANEKYTIMSPFDITQKVLGPYMFSPTSRETLNEKMELYFQDHSFVPLFIQENYLKTQPAKLRNTEGPEKTLEHLRLMERASSSISDGDLVDALIHGPEQHWSLMPLHAICSTVRPASCLYGAGSGYGGPNAMSFPQWLGQNSKQNKLSRQLADIQVRMRLKASGNTTEIRQSYLAALFPHLVKPLIDEGASAVDEVIGRMDEYYLSREDWDTIVELGVDRNNSEVVLKKISPATKTSLTRKYNARDHPIPFHKAKDLGKAPKKIGGGVVPDIEEAFDLDEDVVDDDASDDGKGKNGDDIGGDRLIQVSKKKAKVQAKPRTLM